LRREEGRKERAQENGKEQTPQGIPYLIFQSINVLRV
jgi:hypothetical protein